MRQRRYRVVLLGVEDDLTPLPPPRRRRPRMPAARGLAHWWALSWQLRLATLATLLALSLVIAIVYAHLGG
jgi:hypothetical protein